MKRKLLSWISAVIGFAILGAGIYTYQVYASVSETLSKVSQPLKRDALSKQSEDMKQGAPISILLMGADPREGERGRSDSLMLVTLNRTKQSMKIVSIPRDTYTEIVGRGVKDKINHAYAFGGVDATVATVEKFLNVPVQYYIEVNMEGFQDIVNAVGGVDVNNDMDFKLAGIHFAKGPIHLNGEEALVYSRMRKLDPRGDFGRQMRQRQVIQSVIKNGKNTEILSSYEAILGAIQKNVKTNLTQDEMFKIQQNYKETRNNIEEIEVKGEGKMMGDTWYYFVPDEVRQELSKKLREQLELPVQ
ncbi:polyisoprenyl-teichoic acid--peptidoglycan teichoic acid transferase TagU [Ectobacillus funiculus]|uniref:LytR family transcriptional regulator n=1 Tax=Ectobacillus funiculus TaxID=137993 RepID=A0ABV5WC44_9BACI